MPKNINQENYSNMTQVTKWNIGNFTQQLIEEGKTSIKIEWYDKGYYIISWN